MSLFGDFASAGLGAYGYTELMDRMGDRQDSTRESIQDMQEGVLEQQTFTPWGVKGNTGNVNVTKEGMDFSLNPEDAMFSRMARAGSIDAFGRAGGPSDVNEYYEKLRQAKAATDRQNYNRMGSGLFNRGRTGVRSNEFGGSPEEYAFMKAREDSMAQDWLTAYQAMQGERELDTKIGSSLLDASYSPQRELGNLMQYGINNRQLQDQMTREGTSLWTQLGLGGLSTDTNYENIRGKAFGDMIKTLMPLAQAGGDAFAGAGVWSDISDWWDNL
jgi:hypothetical protein